MQCSKHKGNRNLNPINNYSKQTTDYPMKLTYEFLNACIIRQLSKQSDGKSESKTHNGDHIMGSKKQRSQEHRAKKKLQGHKLKPS